MSRPARGGPFEWRIHTHATPRGCETFVRSRPGWVKLGGAGVNGCDLAIQLGEVVEDGRILDDRAARSLLAAWSSDEGWSPAQARLVARLVHEAPLPAGEERAVAPYTYQIGGAWHWDTRPARQALRGRKSGIVRRWRTRNRDALIRKLRRQGKSLAEIAAVVGLSRQGVAYILKRVVSSPLPRLAAVKRTIRRMPGRYPRAVLERLPGRTSSIRDALLRWCGLRVTRSLSDDAVRLEARRLNEQLDRTLPGRRLDETVDRVLRERRRWAA